MVTVIGIIALLLSIIAFFKSEKWLINLIIFFSVFTAAIAFINPVTILPFEIPMMLLLLKYAVAFIKNKPKIDFTIIKSTIKNNKIFTAILIFAVALTLSEIWILVSGFEYNYYDLLYKEDRVIKFTLYNFSQYIRYMFYLVVMMALSLKIKDRSEIKGYLKVFGYASLFAIFWGFVQYILYCLNIPYPNLIFNNNPYAYQGFDQIMHNFNRVNSIALEPSTFALHIGVFLPFVLLPWLFSKRKPGKMILIIAILTIICGLFSFSSTIILSFVIQFLIILLVIIFGKNKDKGKLFLKYIFIAVVSIGLTYAICISSSYIRNNIVSNKDNVVNVDDKSDIEEEVKNESEDVINSILEITINKINTGSAEERWAREEEGINIYKLSPIFGVGITSVRTFTLFTNILVNVGIIGLISMIYIFYVALKNVIKNRKKDYLAALVFIFSIIGMLVPFIFSVPDISFIYCWIILVLAYNYFNCKDEEKKKKNEIVIGVDARGLDANKAGIATYIEKNLEQFNNFKKDNVKFILYSTNKIDLNFIPKDNFEIKDCSKYKIGTIFVRYFLPKILYNDKVDIFWGTQHVLPIRNENTSDIKYVLTVHDLAIHKLGNVGNRKNTIIQKMYLKKSCRSADSIIAISKSTKNDIMELFKIREEKINVIYLGTNLSSKYDLSEKDEKKILKKFNVENKKYLFFVSTIEPRKNIVTLVKAFEVLKEQNKELKLILAGGLGWKYENIVSAINESKYKDDINLAGYVSKDEKDCLMHNCKCLVYPSLYEGFGLPVLEGMAHETIVVTSNNSSLPEVGGDIAFYYNNIFNYNELALVIQKVLEMNDKDKKVIIKKGLDYIKSFSWEKCAKEILKLLLSI